MSTCLGTGTYDSGMIETRYDYFSLLSIACEDSFFSNSLYPILLQTRKQVGTVVVHLQEGAGYGLLICEALVDGDWVAFSQA
jgi:hypothetical protein